MTPTINPEDWTATLHDLLHYYLPPLPNSPAVNIASLLAIAAGLFLVFRGMKSDRMVVTGFAVVLGAWLGYEISQLIRAPGPISSAVGAVLVAGLAYRTYRWWLAAGSVVVLFALATFLQLGRGDLHRYLPTSDQVGAKVQGDVISGLVSPEQQQRNLHPNWDDQLERIKTRVTAELKGLGLTGWLVPLAGAIVGGVLAFYALRAFSVIWMGFVGALVAVLGACTFLCAHWPSVRTALFARPQAPFGVAIGLWLLGLILQAKEARLPKKKPDAPAKDAPKS